MKFECFSLGKDAKASRDLLGTLAVDKANSKQPIASAHGVNGSELVLGVVGELLKRDRHRRGVLQRSGHQCADEAYFTDVEVGDGVPVHAEGHVGVGVERADAGDRGFEQAGQVRGS